MLKSESETANDNNDAALSSGEETTLALEKEFQPLAIIKMHLQKVVGDFFKLHEKNKLAIELARIILAVVCDGNIANIFNLLERLNSAIQNIEDLQIAGKDDKSIRVELITGIKAIINSSYCRKALQMEEEIKKVQEVLLVDVGKLIRTKNKELARAHKEIDELRDKISLLTKINLNLKTTLEAQTEELRRLQGQSNQQNDVATVSATSSNNPVITALNTCLCILQMAKTQPKPAVEVCIKILQTAQTELVKKNLTAADDSVMHVLNITLSILSKYPQDLGIDACIAEFQVMLDELATNKMPPYEPLALKY